jgi:hypothetical protein
MIEGFTPFPFNEAPIIGIMEAKKKKKSAKDKPEKAPRPSGTGHREHRFAHGLKRSQRHTN